MSLLAGLKVTEAVEGDSDVLGGSVVDSGIYPCVINVAYVDESKGGAKSFNLHLTTDKGQAIKQTLYVTSGKAKGCLPYYERNGKKQFLPGYNQANAVCILTLDREISEMDTEEKVVNIYDYEAKKELPTKVAMITDLLNQRVDVGIIKQVVDKNAKNAAGIYVPTGETREENEITKVFRASDGLTVNEIKAGETKPDFRAKWAKKFTGTVRNKAKGAAEGSTAGAPKTSAAPAETASLFS